MSRSSLRQLDAAVSMIRTTWRALEPIADSEVGGTNEGAELVAIDAMATLQEAADTLGEYFSDLHTGGDKAVDALQEAFVALTDYDDDRGDPDSAESRACATARAAVRRALAALDATEPLLGEVEIDWASHCRAYGDAAGVACCGCDENGRRELSADPSNQEIERFLGFRPRDMNTARHALRIHRERSAADAHSATDQAAEEVQQ